MSETANIAEIAVKISKDIFKHFLWQTHQKREDMFSKLLPFGKVLSYQTIGIFV